MEYLALFLNDKTMRRTAEPMTLQVVVVNGLLFNG